jgi:DNA polymerase III epsilon subunit-like protein
MPDKKTLIFDTETTGLPTRDRKIRKDPLSWPRLVEIGWIICSQDGTQLFEESMIIIPEGFAIPEPATKIHGITTEEAKLSGVSIDVALDLFCTAAGHADYYVAHNLSYDIRIILS